jgi:NAD(P)-dependent dehydrogenase (short-subunit alcohol dehydrogenase family)
MRLAGKVAIISGAASGMGAATARMFAREGAKVVIADVLEHEGRQVADTIGASARFELLDVTKDAPFVLQESYFGRERFEDTEVRNGLKMHFAGWSQPLESYMAALENVGLTITSLREPVPDAANKGSHMERWNKVPLFLWLKARSVPI